MTYKKSEQMKDSDTTVFYLCGENNEKGLKVNKNAFLLFSYVLFNKNLAVYLFYLCKGYNCTFFSTISLTFISKYVII